MTLSDLAIDDPIASAKRIYRLRNISEAKFLIETLTDDQLDRVLRILSNQEYPWSQIKEQNEIIAKLVDALQYKPIP